MHAPRATVSAQLLTHSSSFPVAPLRCSSPQIEENMQDPNKPAFPDLQMQYNHAAVQVGFKNKPAHLHWTSCCYCRARGRAVLLSAVVGQAALSHQRHAPSPSRACAPICTACHLPACLQVAFVAGCFYTGVGLLRMGGWPPCCCRSHAVAALDMALVFGRTRLNYHKCPTL